MINLKKFALCLIIASSFSGCASDSKQTPGSNPAPSNPQQKPEQQIKS